MDLEGHAVLKTHTGYRFDAAISSPSGRFALLFERLGTKALLFDRGEIVRELSRSYYHAATYEYPAAFCSLPDGTELLIHCPRAYCRIDIEVAESGEILTEVSERKPEDAFHSRLTVSPRGTWLASAGWFWHPWDFATVWSLEAALQEPRLLDSCPRLPLSGEVSGAVFLDDERVLAWVFDDDLSVSEGRNKLVTFNLRNQAILGELTLAGPAGTLVPFGPDLILTLCDHPRLLRVSSGDIVYDWPHLPTGRQWSSIIQSPLPPPFAKHPTKPIFAVAGEETVTIVKLEGGLD